MSEPNQGQQMVDECNQVLNEIRNRCVRVTIRTDGSYDQTVDLHTLRKSILGMSKYTQSFFILGLCHLLQERWEDEAFVMEGMWIMMAFLLEFGQSSPFGLKFKEKVPDLFQWALEMIEERRLSVKWHDTM